MQEIPGNEKCTLFKMKHTIRRGPNNQGWRLKATDQMRVTAGKDLKTNPTM